MVMLGGMIAPIVPAVAIRAAAKPALYPVCFMVGMRIEPIADASAVEEPETPDDHHAGDDRGMREAGAEMADQRAREIDQLLADAARRHDRAGEDEIGHRQQREGIELAEHLLREQRHHELGQQCDADEADQRDAQQDRDARPA